MDKQSTASEFQGMLEARGVSRRSFMKLCGTLAVMAGLGEAAAPRVAQALEESVIGASQGDLYPVIWIEGASCTGCTEAFAQIDAPDAAAVVLELISLNYSETLSAAAAAFAARGLEAQVTQIWAARSKGAGGLNLMMGQNPVWLISGRRREEEA